MADLMDINLEFDPHRLMREQDPTRTIAEASHHHATETAHLNGRTLVDPEPIDVVTTKAVTPTGFDVLLVATRWRLNPD